MHPPKDKMRTAIITTFFNEAKDIETFLGALNEQTKLPSEIILVDAFSNDKTFEIAKEAILKFNRILKITHLLRKKGNRSVGRNFAIKKSTSSIIAVTDVGCIPDKKWFEKITNPFKKGVPDVVAGVYKPIASNTFEKSLAAYTSVPLEKVNKNFLPSSRSVSFKKTAWEKVGGYPEHLDTCEDLVFSRDLKRYGFNFVVVKSAFVKWPQIKNFMEAFKQFYSYAKGDGQAVYIRWQTPFLFGRYFLGLVILFCWLTFNNSFFLILEAVGILIYLFWSVWKNYKYVKDIEAIIILPILQVVSDVAVIAGMSIGLLNRPKSR